jgi:hypothetical protein
MAYLLVSQNTFGTSTPDRLFYFWNLRSLFLIDNLKIVDLGCLDFKFGLLAETSITTLLSHGQSNCYHNDATAAIWSQAPV